MGLGGAEKLSAFLAMMSHEFRTPLNAIVGFTDLLQSTSIDPTQRTYLKTIDRSSGLLLKLIEDILDLSQIESDQFKLNVELVAVLLVVYICSSAFDSCVDRAPEP